ncbi:cytochrome c oxidase subunit II [Lignipirellula cremea]|uniref:cytochrome-c oxidase n=1 Tax=Lignipirellula cremea TaxID=2528010 RepID=A0A518E1X8_9BACT|nr:cytochrome c oxidase subunit II [Lignipirellula cremea]QDU98098.1 Cytochrome c oxidase subunit 2 precursor [Lignipirellula cremea]
MDTSFRLFPDAASDMADQVDRLYFFLLAVSSFFTLLIFVLIVFFVLKYRRGAKVNRYLTPGKSVLALELTWSLIPLGLTMIMFGWGANLFLKLHDSPPDPIEINVLARRWFWRMQHSNGKREDQALHIPVGQPVKLRMISEDVIHSFYVPAFRVKQDVLPGRYTTLGFEPNKVGTFHLFCAEYCGDNHSGMKGQIIVMEPAEYAEWLQGGPSEAPEVAGKKLFEEYRCASCHTSPVNPRCPPLEGLYGRTVKLTDGRTVIADDDYLRRSIVDPAAEVVAGFQPIMPTFKGQLGEESIFALTAYLKTLEAPTPGAGQAGEAAIGDTPPSDTDSKEADSKEAGPEPAPSRDDEPRLPAAPSLDPPRDPSPPEPPSKENPAS